MYEFIVSSILRGHFQRPALSRKGIELQFSRSGFKSAFGRLRTFASVRLRPKGDVRLIRSNPTGHCSILL
jgi:hypothetical protein